MALLHFMEILLAGALCFLIAIRHRRLNRNAAVTTWPVIGMLPALLHNMRRVHDYATEILKRSGGTLDFRTSLFSNMDFIITCDPLNIQHVSHTNFANYPKGADFREMFDVLGDGILNVDGDLWRLQRKMFQLWSTKHGKYEFVSRTIQRKVVDDLIPFLDHVSETGIQVDLQEVFQKMITFDNALSLIFGADVASHKFKFSKAKYQQAFGDIQEAVFRRHVVPRSFWKLQRWLPVGAERKYTRALNIFSEFVHDCVALRREMFDRKCREEQELAAGADLDMMAVYLEEKKKPHLDKFLKDVGLNFIAASRDTLTGALTWFFWLVATHPYVEAKILDELRENLPPEEGFFAAAQDLNKLVYLQAALYETFRLYPLVPFNHKTAVKADTLPSGHHVKANQAILISYYSMGRMEEIWGPDCSEFKPERWIDRVGKAPRLVYVAPHKYAAFGVGPRTCLGRDMVVAQIKVVAINVLRSYRLHVVEGHPIVPRLTVTLDMKHGLKINVSKRLND